MCIFCEIVEGRRSAHLVHEDERAVSFLDHRPLFEGHTLVVPRTHHETLGDLPFDEIAPFFSLVQRHAVAIPVAMDAAGTFVAVNNIVSQSVPHLHVHVVPRRPKDGLRGFFWPRTTYASDDAMVATAARIRRVLEAD